MNITLENQHMKIVLSKTESMECATYLTALLKSNNVQGMTYHDDINDTDIITAWSINSNLYSALMQIQNESTVAHFTIE